MQVQSLPPTPPRRTPTQIQRAVLLALVIRELRTRVEGRWFGLLWLLAEPLFHVLLILGLFGFRTHAGGVEFPVFLVTGIVPYFLFRNIARRLPNAIAANRNLFSYRQVKPIDAMVARSLVEIGLYAGVYCIALGLLGYLGYHWSPEQPLELLFVLAMMVAFGFAFGLLCTVLAHNRPRVESFIGMLFLPLYFVSGVIFPFHSLPQELRDWMIWNPMLHMVDLCRVYFLHGYQRIPGVEVAYPAAATLTLLALAMSLYRLKRHDLIASA